MPYKTPASTSQLFELQVHTSSLPENVQVFGSGANRVEEIEGFASLDIPVGVSIQQINEAAIQTLIYLQRPVMIDSGAFSEVRACPEGLMVVAPITDADWKRRLFQYERLAHALGNKALVVVPDRVGSQQETLTRVNRYRHDLAILEACDSPLLLPLQLGDLSHREFFVRASEAAGVQMIPAFPMRKAATSIATLLDFVDQVRPHHIHLLGAGIENRRAAKIVKFLLARFANLRITMDSNRLRAVIGKARPLTLTEKRLRSEEITDLYGAVESLVLDRCGRGLDYTDLIASPALWARNDDLMEVANYAGLGPHETAALIANPDGFLQSPVGGDSDMNWIEHPLIAIALDNAWERFVSRTVRSSVRTAAIAEVFANSRISGQWRQSRLNPRPFSYAESAALQRPSQRAR